MTIHVLCVALSQGNTHDYLWGPLWCASCVMHQLHAHQRAGPRGGGLLPLPRCSPPRGPDVSPVRVCARGHRLLSSPTTPSRPFLMALLLHPSLFPRLYILGVFPPFSVPASPAGVLMLCCLRAVGRALSSQGPHFPGVPGGMRVWARISPVSAAARVGCVPSGVGWPSQGRCN